MRARLLSALCFVLLGFAAANALAQPSSVAVYPFSSQDVFVGVAVAERIADTLEEATTVFGPAVTPGLVPPLVVEDGFLNPMALLGLSGAALDSPNAVALLRDTLGTEMVISGGVSFAAEELVLSLLVATPEAVRSFQVTAPEDQPGLLAEKALTLLSSYYGFGAANADITIDLSGAYGNYIRAVALLGGGVVDEALGVLEAAISAEANPEWQSLLEDVQATRLGKVGENAALQAALSLSLPSFDTELISSYFDAVAAQGKLPAAYTWLGALAASEGNRAAAVQAFDEAAGYPYGRAARAMYRAAEGLEGSRDDIQALADAEQRGALLGAVLAAQQLADTALEKQLLTRLTHEAPSFSYPFDRLSRIAFEENEPLVAAQALAVAVGLEPNNDIFWTNLGWSYYLLGLLDKSETASLHATELGGQPEVAWFNLGLVRTVEGRLAEAMTAYDQALALDPAVNDEAIVDLENALELYPNEAAVHFALATLYEAEGRREEAAAQFALYAELTEEGPYRARALQRVEILNAPPPPIELRAFEDEGLFPGGVEAAPYHPGDRIYPTLELSTPGYELPSEVVLGLELLNEDGTPIENAALSQQIRIPPNVVAITLDNVGLDLPKELPAGTYSLVVTITAGADRKDTLALPVEVVGEALLLRQLISRNIGLYAVESGANLYADIDPEAENADDVLVDRLVSELRATDESAEEVLPEITQGRFAGQSGGELFRNSTAEDVRDFLTFLLGEGAASEVDFAFADAYAQWALDGAP